MSKFAIGTAQFGMPYGISNKSGQVKQEQIFEILSIASTLGIDTLDTAVSYGDSEKNLGLFGVEKFKVISKLPLCPVDSDDVYSWVVREVNESLDRLSISCLYGLLFHTPEQLLKSNGLAIFRAVEKLKDLGRIKKVGISIYSPEVLQKLIPKYSIDIVQAPFNLLDRRILNSGWMQRLKDLQIELHTRSTFLQGLLLESYQNINPKFQQWDHIWFKWYRWLKKNRIGQLEACLALPLSFPEIDRVIVGIDNLSQLIEILNSENNIFNAILPNIQSNDEDLINPSNWSKL